MEKKSFVIVALLTALIISLMTNFSQWQHGKMVEHDIIADNNSVVTLEHFADQPIDMRRIELVVDGQVHRFAIGEIKNADAQPGSGRLPMIYVYNGTTPVAKVNAFTNGQ